jgi:predicted solute-binding protein
MTLCTTLTSSEVKEILDAELWNDTTDMAVKFQVFCEAAAVDNKEKYWNKIVNKDAGSYTILEMMMRGFNILRQKDILIPFLDRYFQYITYAIENEPMEIADKFMKSMLPIWAETSVVIEKLRQIQTSKSWAQKSIANIIEDLARNQEKQDLVRKSR